jgi:hypothetical protein
MHPVASHPNAQNTSVDAYSHPPLGVHFPGVSNITKYSASLQWFEGGVVQLTEAQGSDVHAPAVQPKEQ